MYDTTIPAKLLKQHESFLGRISPHFHKPVARFVGDMVYGIMVEKDVKLSSVVRALKEKSTPKKVEAILAIPSETTPRSRCQIFTWRKMKTATSPFVYKGAAVFRFKKLRNLQHRPRLFTFTQYPYCGTISSALWHTD